jgi:hypothetical protein
MKAYSSFSDGVVIDEEDWDSSDVAGVRRL